MTPVKRYKLDTDVGYNGEPFVIPAGQVMIREADYKDLERQVADLTAQVEAQHAEIRDMRKSLDTAAKGIVRLTTERDDLTRRLEEAQACAEYALIHPASDQAFALRAVQQVLREGQP